MSNSIGRYWRFFWPLMILSIALLSGRLIQNFVLLEYPDGTIELAIFVLAFQLFRPMNTTLVMLPQVVNILATSRQAFRVTIGFSLFASLILSLPVLLLAWMPIGERLIRLVFDISPDWLLDVRYYLRLFCPIIVITAISKCFVGILIKQFKTGIVTILQIASLAVLTLLALIGFHASLPAFLTIGGSWLISEILFLFASLYCQRKYAPLKLLDANESSDVLRWNQIWKFAWPVAATTFMFSLSRPIIFSFITKLDHSYGSAKYTVDQMIAGLGLAVTFQMIFHGIINQFRDVFVTFGKEDFHGVVRFMSIVTVFGTVIILTLNMTPLAHWYLSIVQGAEGETLQVAMECIWVLTLLPAVLVVRNYYHGLSLINRKTKGMAVGGLLRNGSILGGCFLLYILGRYNHVAAVSVLMFGFFFEGIGVQFASRRWRRELGKN